MNPFDNKFIDYVKKGSDIVGDVTSFPQQFPGMVTGLVEDQTVGRLPDFWQSVVGARNFNPADPINDFINQQVTPNITQEGLTKRGLSMASDVLGFNPGDIFGGSTPTSPTPPTTVTPSKTATAATAAANGATSERPVGEWIARLSADERRAGMRDPKATASIILAKNKIDPTSPAAEAFMETFQDEAAEWLTSRMDKNGQYPAVERLYQYLNGYLEGLLEEVDEQNAMTEE